MNKLLTKKDLAERWQVSTTTIDRWVEDGVISPVRGLPSKRFNLEHVLKLEGTEVGRMSPLERKRLEKEIERLNDANEELKRENQELKSIITEILSLSARAQTLLIRREEI